jgi:hypothetical protein
MSRLRLHLLAVLGIAAATPLAAQQRSPVSLEASFGVGSGQSDGVYRERTGLVVDATLTLRLRPTRSGAMLLAVSGGGHGILTDVTSICDPTPDGGCARAYPAFYSLGLLAGREWQQWRGSSVRALAGPAYYRARSRGGGTGGLQARLDVATPPLWRIAFLGSFRGAVLPGFRRERHTLGALALGVRLQ